MKTTMFSLKLRHFGVAFLVASVVSMTAADTFASGTPLGAPATADAGEYCAAGTDAASLSEFWGSSHGSWYGGDYLRPFKLADGRVLWTMQDAAVTTPGGAVKIVHNMAFIQSGNCFSPLSNGLGTNHPKSWLLANETNPFHNWFWPIGGEMDPNGTTFHLLMAQMSEPGRYLTNTRPVATWIVDLNIADMSVIGYAPAPNSSAELYGFSVTSDSRYTYLYSNCYIQFPFFEECSGVVKVARVLRGQLNTQPTYWNGTNWTSDAASAVAVVTFYSTAFGVNPAQVMWDGTRFMLIEKEGDWFGTNVLVQTSPNPTGPWTTIATIVADNPGGDATNTYFATWTPWQNPGGDYMWNLSHNRWDGQPSQAYRPSFHTVAVPRPREITSCVRISRFMAYC